MALRKQIKKLSQYSDIYINSTQQTSLDVCCVEIVKFRVQLQRKLDSRP